MTAPLGVWAWFPGTALTGDHTTEAWDAHDWDAWEQDTVYGDNWDSTRDRTALAARAAHHYQQPVTLIAATDALPHGEDTLVIATMLIYPQEGPCPR